MADTFTTKLGLRQYDAAGFYDVSKISADNLLVDNAFGTVICTSTTRPSSGLFNGMTLWETDTRRFVVRVAGAWTVVPGRALIADATARAAITTPYDGMEIYRQDRDWTEIYDGAAWRVQGIAMCTTVADRNAIITSPYNGQFAVTMDSDTLWQYDSVTSAWKCMAGQGVIARGRRTNTSSGSSADGVDVAVLRVSNVLLRAGRLYKIWTTPLGLDSTSVNDEIAARIRYTTNATNATTASTILPGSNIQTRQTDANVAEHKAIQAPLTGLDVTASFLLCVRRFAGAGSCAVYVDGVIGDAIDLVIEDVGFDPGDTGTGNTL